ncbi:MAG: threonine--tRNA ligase [Gemmatimonadetes bacterium]|nr:threonine--tRNA ligase [Gemmatimonadota bacterium]
MPSPSVDPKLSDLRERMRHSAAHVLAEAVMKLFPEAKPTIGPPTEDGFYYDFDVPAPFTPDDIQRIEALMRESIAQDLPFTQERVTRERAREAFKDNPYKIEMIGELPEDEPITVVRHGDFRDLCRGGHVDSTGRIGAFKLLNTAGAYWRGDERNPMLQRIYGTAWESQSELDACLERRAEAERRDHRRLGREQDLFFLDPISPASPFFLPKGALVYNLLVDYVRGLYRRYGYQEIITPEIYSTDLWKRSGHYDNYIENMYLIEIDEREYGVKPMNCPAAAMVYASTLRSYRDLPIRLADFGRLHRYERSGVTHGLTRVRSFAQDDAHIFCTPEQVGSEVRNFIGMLTESCRYLGFNQMRFVLSLRPEKRIGSDETWDRAEQTLETVLAEAGLDFETAPGEGAFYGPKIDHLVPDAIGREWQLGTVQLDFAMPERFDLEYVAEDGGRRRPVMLHRTMLGTIERFMGVFIEHTVGAFPLWLAPVQATLIPIADRHLPYARTVADRLERAGFRVEVDDSSERMNAKIRTAQLQKVPYMLVVGDREEHTGEVAVRLRDGRDLGPMPLQQLLERMRGELSAPSGA